ncbi:MAG: sulfate adenylyltransferase [Nitrospinae bacterium]|nr:sulfate adenylyltransferase [Nitrospinota bacterium]
MSKMVPPHGGALKSLKLEGAALAQARERARSLKSIRMTTRERDDLIMMGIGAFSPLRGFMGREDWKGVCEEMRMADGTFWPIPITLSTDQEGADRLREREEVALVDGETGEIMGSLVVEEKYTIDKGYECQEVFKTEDPAHPGVKKVMAQAGVNLSGPVQVFSEGEYAVKFSGIYATPAETRAIFEEKGWRTVAALQLRNPMHRSHEYLAKIALEVLDGLFIHQLLGALKPGDIPAKVRVRCIDVLVEHYFPKERVVQKGYPLEMRYAGPREALLHACFRQNYGASHLIVGRDHAGVGNYYGPFEAQEIFDQLPEGALAIRPLKIDWTFHCYQCEGMASWKTCPHGPEEHLNVSGTELRKILSEGKRPAREFSRPEVLEILAEYYRGLGGKR